LGTARWCGGVGFDCGMVLVVSVGVALLRRVEVGRKREGLACMCFWHGFALCETSMFKFIALLCSAFLTNLDYRIDR